jgi:acetyl esterase/lipase
MDVPYSTILGFRPLKLDLYLPPAGGGAKPMVIWVHGGGWFTGDPRAGSQPGGPYKDWPGVLAALSARGYVVAGVSYRLTGEARFPAQIEDVKAAVRWLKRNAGVYGGDSSRVVAWGASAGGHLAALLGTSCGVAELEGPVRPGDPSSCVQAVVDWYGPIDFTQLDALDFSHSNAHAPADSPESRYLGCPLPRCPPERLRQANAITYVDAKDPPFLIMHGDADVSVAPKESQLLLDALKKAGVKAELIYVPGVKHSFVGATPEQGKMILDRVFAFIDETVGSSGKH